MKPKTETGKTIYRYSGWFYGFAPCILSTNGMQIVKYRPYWLILYPLVWVAELVHLIDCQLSPSNIREELPKKPFYSIKKLNPYITR